MRASTETELQELKEDAIRCFEGAALSIKCKLKISDKMHYKGMFIFR